MANEKRLISYDAVYQYAFDGVNGGGMEHEDFDAIINAIDAVPTIDAVEVVHGRWVRLDAHKGIEQFKCSVCRSECYVPTCMNEPMYEYCPNCGSKMDGERRTENGNQA